MSSHDQSENYAHKSCHCNLEHGVFSRYLMVNTVECSGYVCSHKYRMEIQSIILYPLLMLYVHNVGFSFSFLLFLIVVDSELGWDVIFNLITLFEFFSFFLCGFFFPELLLQ